jgi:predicted acyltransferase
MKKPDRSGAGRQRSLDAFRGLLVLLMIAEASGLVRAVHDAVPPGTFAAGIADQLFRPPWNGLRFWSLLYPGFLLAAGVSLAFSADRRISSGGSWFGMTGHVLVRAGILFFLGLALQCISSGRLVFELWNPLSQLAVTLLAAFLFLRFPFAVQFGFSIALLVASELAYRLCPFPGFDQPFVQGHNFGSWMDVSIMGALHPDGWVAVDCLPASAITIWGALAGRLLLSGRRNVTKIRSLAVAGLSGLVVGYGLDWLSISPMVERICTGSFVIASAGWALLGLLAFFWVGDVKGRRPLEPVLAVPGTNALFLFAFANSAGIQWLNGTVGVFTGGFTARLGMTDSAVSVLTALVVCGLEWAMADWLSRRSNRD